MPTRRTSSISKTPVRLYGIQIYVSAGSLEPGQQARVDQACSTLGEIFRLWLREHSVEAPFRKMLVHVRSEESQASSPSSVSTTLGVCTIRIALRRELILADTKDLRWLLRPLLDALSSAQQEHVFHSVELNSFARHLAQAEPPHTHVFRQLIRRDPLAKITCTTWISFDVDRTRIGVLLEPDDEPSREVILVEKTGALVLDDEFPIADVQVRGPNLIFTDRHNRRLAQVALSVSV